MVYRLHLHVRRDPSVAPAVFRQHYEEFHVPLIRTVAGHAFPMRHIRHFIRRTDEVDANGNPRYPATVLSGTQEDFSYPVLCELVFEDEQHFMSLAAATNQGEGEEILDKDGAAFVNVTRLRAVVVGETIVTER